MKLNRRLFMAATAALATAPACAKPQPLELFIGTYNSDTSKGIYPLTYTAASDSWQIGAAIPGPDNVSFGVYSPLHGLHYLLDEKDDGQVGVWCHKDGAWTRVATASTQGSWPCYAALSPDERALAVANYGAGNILIYPLDEQGGLGEAVVRQNAGTGPNKDRQEGPHAHWVQFSPDGSHIYSVDLGTDEVLGFTYDAATRAVGDKFVAYKAPAGSGPRHLAFHPGGQVAFLVTELDNQLISLKRQADGTLVEIARASLLPADFTGQSQAAHIAINAAGNRVYASNRGHNSIAVFEVDAEGALKLLQIAPTLGDWPRFFALYEAQKRLVVAHQNGNDLVVFTVAEDGTISPRGQTVSVPKPVFIGRV